MGEEMTHDPMRYLDTDPAQKLKDQAKPFDAKKQCWIATSKDDLDGYTEAEILDVEGDKVKVRAKGVEKLVSKDEMDQLNPPKYEKCVDMANLTYLSEASVLYNLRARYEAGLIYTYSGLFCIAVNPYRRLPIYLDTVVTMYRGKRRPEMPPHIFSIVDNAYQDMLIEHDNQSMLITGESGAGKTENTKKVIQYIAKVAGVAEKKEDSGPKEVAGIKGSLDEQVVQANPLLEAFGNAKTTRNNNSSRFGKFIRCHFSSTGKLAGADIESYLLEKNRVTHQGSAERNYHIFYQILYSSTDEELAALCLPTRDAHAYGFLADGVTHVDRMDDLEEYALTVDAIQVLGFTPEEKVSMFKITASILNMSMMKWKQKPREDQAEVDGPEDGERVCYLLGMQVKEYLNSLIKPKVKVGTEYVNKGQTVEQVTNAVGALAKAIFGRMFWWMVERVNKALDTKQKRAYFIGVLDIAGFEIFDYNSFDQLCINLTNEKLQQFFNHHMFVLEQEEYKREGIVWEFIDFGMDLEETINLVEKPLGIFAMLEEECIVPKATDTTYLNKLHKEHAGKSKSYTKPTPKQSKQGMGDFILHHYAGDVGYSVAGWLDKNKDPINEHCASLFAKAGDPLTSYLFVDYDPDKNKGKKAKGGAFQTVSYRHKEQLKSLIGTLMATSPHFVRCLIPNEQKSSTMVEGQLILHQLRCNGVLEGIRICRKGFPSRMLFSDFKQRYRILAASAIPEGFIDGKVAAEKLIDALQLDENEFKIGLTKVFFRSGIVGELEELRDERLSKIIAQFQAYCKGHIQRVEFKKLLDRKIGVSVLQRNIRKFFGIRNWPWWGLYIQVQPMLTIARAEDEMLEKEAELKKAMEDAEANAAKLKDIESSLTDIQEEKAKLVRELESETEKLADTQEQLRDVTYEKDQLESSYNELQEKLEGEEHAASTSRDKVRKLEKEIEELSTKGSEQRDSIAKLTAEKNSALKQIDSLNEDIKKGEDVSSKLGKDKKGLEEALQIKEEDLLSTENKLRNLNVAKNKVEASLKESNHSLAKEKEVRAKTDKDKRKLEADLKDTKQKLTEAEDGLTSGKDTLQKRDKSIKELEEVKESSEAAIKQLQKKIQELLGRIEELEEELENEKKARQKVDLNKKDLEAQLEEIQEQLIVQGDATNAQVDVIKKRDSEINRLRQEIEEANIAGDAALASARSKANLALGEVQDELDAVKKQKQRSDKEKTAVGNELSEVQSNFEQVRKQKIAGDKANRALEDQLNELRGKLAEAESRLQDTEIKASKSAGESSNLGRQLEESEHRLANVMKEKKSSDNALQEAKQAADDEAKAKHDIHLKLKDAHGEIEGLREQLEEEQSARAQMQSKLSKALSEASSMRGPVEDGPRVEELEDAKRRLSNRVQEMEEALTAAETKASGMEKVKNRMNEEVEDLLLDLEKAQALASQLEKKQKKVDAQINEWRVKVDELNAELEKTQKDARIATAEVIKLRADNEDLEEKYDKTKRENRNLTAEVESMQEQLVDPSKTSAEVERIQRKLGLENEELQNALEEAETALEIEEGKVLKLTLELTHIKQTTDRRLREKEEEIDGSRRNHARQIEALQSTVDHEMKSKGELLRDKKAHDTQVAELEHGLTTATKNAGEYQKTLKKLQAQVKELQSIVDEESTGRDEARASLSRSEKRANEMEVQVGEARLALEQCERARKSAEAEKNENSDRLSELQALYNNATNAKRKAEQDFQNLQEDIEELENDAKASEEKAAKAGAEVTRLMNELNSANDATSTADKSRALLARQISELQQQVESTDASGGRGMKNQIRKLEGRIIELESGMENETRKANEVLKDARKAEKRVKDLEIAIEEGETSAAKSAESVDKLTTKLKNMRVAFEEAEANCHMLQSKYKKAASDLEDAEERVEAAEKALLKTR